MLNPHTLEAYNVFICVLDIEIDSNPTRNVTMEGFKTGIIIHFIILHHFEFKILDCWFYSRLLKPSDLEIQLFLKNKIRHRADIKMCRTVKRTTFRIKFNVELNQQFCEAGAGNLRSGL